MNLEGLPSPESIFSNIPEFRNLGFFSSLGPHSSPGLVHLMVVLERWFCPGRPGGLRGLSLVQASVQGQVINTKIPL